jgi:hypothetical protein
MEKFAREFGEMRNEVTARRRHKQLPPDAIEYEDEADEAD